MIFGGTRPSAELQRRRVCLETRQCAPSLRMKRIMCPFSLPRRFSIAIVFSITATLAFWLAGQPARAAETNSTVRPGGFQFDGKISRPVLENYLSRSICIEGMLNARGPLTDDIRMITNSGAKYIARALCLWGAENNFLANIAKKEAPQ